MNNEIKAKQAAVFVACTAALQSLQFIVIDDLVNGVFKNDVDGVTTGYRITTAFTGTEHGMRALRVAKVWADKLPQMYDDGVIPKEFIKDFFAKSPYSDAHVEVLYNLARTELEKLKVLQSLLPVAEQKFATMEA